MGPENEELRQLVALGEKQLEELRTMKENLQTLAEKQEELLRHMLHRLMYAERA